MDGASHDATVEILERNASRIEYWESEPDRGVYHAWNKALEHATGDWICFLGADDRFAAPDVLSRMAPHLTAAEADYRVVYGTIQVVDRDGEVTMTVGSPWDEIADEFRQRMTLPNPGTFYHRSLFELHGTFDERFRITGDYEFLLRELKENPALYVPDIIVTIMDDGGLSADPRNRPRRVQEIVTTRHRHGLSPVPAWASPLVVRAHIRGRLERSVGTAGTERVARWYHRLARRSPDS
jgi:glycosyltransferase involved in cell wall biosynthesis